MINFPLIVCIFPTVGQNRARTVSYPEYLDEVLRHAGVFHQRVPLNQLEASLDSARILLTIGDTDFPEPLKQKLTKFVHDGGAWISIAGTCGMDDLLGAAKQPPDMWSWGGGLRSLGEGYLVALEKDHPILGNVIR